MVTVGGRSSRSDAGAERGHCCSAFSSVCPSTSLFAIILAAKAGAVSAEKDVIQRWGACRRTTVESCKARFLRASKYVGTAFNLCLLCLMYSD